MANNLVIENAHITFRNFAGKESRFNKAGTRTFCVFIDNPEQAQELLNDGWNVRALNPRDPDDEIRYYIQVTVGFDYNPPTIYIIDENKKTKIDEDTIDILDYAEIANIDMTIRPYAWEVNGKKGIKAYLRSMYVTIEKDEFASKYAMEESPEELPWN